VDIPGHDRFAVFSCRALLSNDDTTLVYDFVNAAAVLVHLTLRLIVRPAIVADGKRSARWVALHGRYVPAVATPAGSEHQSEEW
jgi:hypothetical protein